MVIVFEGFPLMSTMVMMSGRDPVIVIVTPPDGAGPVSVTLPIAKVCPGYKLLAYWEEYRTTDATVAPFVGRTMTFLLTWVPPPVAVSVTSTGDATLNVEIAKVCCPPPFGTFMLDGTLTTAVLLVASVTPASSR